MSSNLTASAKIKSPCTQTAGAFYMGARNQRMRSVHVSLQQPNPRISPRPRFRGVCIGNLFHDRTFGLDFLKSGSARDASLGRAQAFEPLHAAKTCGPRCLGEMCVPDESLHASVAAVASRWWVQTPARGQPGVLQTHQAGLDASWPASTLMPMAPSFCYCFNSNKPNECAGNWLIFLLNVATRVSRLGCHFCVMAWLFCRIGAGFHRICC